MPLSLHVSARGKCICHEPITENVCLCQITWMTALVAYFLCNLLEKRYATVIISWHWSLGGNCLANTLRYLSWLAVSMSWHLAAFWMGLGVVSHQAGLLTTLHHSYPASTCFPEQGGNVATTMSWESSAFRHLFRFTLLINEAYMYHNHIPLLYIFNSRTKECWVSFSLSFLPLWLIGYYLIIVLPLSSILVYYTFFHILNVITYW